MILNLFFSETISCTDNLQTIQLTHQKDVIYCLSQIPDQVETFNVLLSRIPKDFQLDYNSYITKCINNNSNQHILFNYCVGIYNQTDDNELWCSTRNSTRT